MTLSRAALIRAFTCDKTGLSAACQVIPPLIS